jgi:hypothetical protein
MSYLLLLLSYVAVVDMAPLLTVAVEYLVPFVHCIMMHLVCIAELKGRVSRLLAATRCGLNK